MKKQKTDNQRRESTIDKYFAQTMEKDEFLRHLIIEAARRFLMDK